MQQMMSTALLTLRHSATVVLATKASYLCLVYTSSIHSMWHRWQYYQQRFTGWRGRTSTSSTKAPQHPSTQVLAFFTDLQCYTIIRTSAQLNVPPGLAGHSARNQTKPAIQFWLGLQTGQPHDKTSVDFCSSSHLMFFNELLIQWHQQ